MSRPTPRYELRVEGILDERWSTWFGGLDVRSEGEGVSVLSGPVADQAALHGLLTRIYDLGLTLISVCPADEPGTVRPDQGRGESLSRPRTADRHGGDRRLARLAVLAGAAALGYGLYRAYYGVGGTAGMFGEPASPAEWRAINLVAAALLFGAALLPLPAVALSHRPWPRRILIAAAWLIAVACIGHALINDVLRVLSLAGRYDILYPPGFWISIDRQAADLQDLLFNETWFLLEGMLWVAIAWTILGPSSRRRRWVGSALVATAVATMIGLLSAAGVIGRTVIG